MSTQRYLYVDASFRCRAAAILRKEYSPTSHCRSATMGLISENLVSEATLESSTTVESRRRPPAAVIAADKFSQLWSPTSAISIAAECNQ